MAGERQRALAWFGQRRGSFGQAFVCSDTEVISLAIALGNAIAPQCSDFSLPSGPNEINRVKRCIPY